MAYKDLREFIKKLEDENELHRIKAPVSAELEICEITDRISKAGGKALLFENVDNSKMPVLINMFGSMRRMNLALQTDSIDKLADEITEILETKTPDSLIQKIKMLPKLKELGDYFPKKVKDAPCREVIITDNPSLDALPALKCWPDDAGKFITLPCVFTSDPDSGARNCGMYRMQVYDSKTTGMHWHIHKDGASIFKKYAERNQKIEVAAAVGTDPAVSFSAITPLPEGIDEMILAGFIRKKPVEMVKCETIDVDVPANSEIILEGYVDPAETRVEGPFGDHTGFYSLAGEYPVFHLTAMTMRKNPVYNTIVVGRPPMEDCFMGTAVETLFLPLLKKQFPEIVDIHMPYEGVFHNLILVSIKKRYPGQARKIMHGLWGTGQIMYTKVIIVTDSDVNLRDPKEVAWKVLSNIAPKRDIEFVTGPTETLDHSSESHTFGSKMGIDATRKWKEEGFNREWPDECKMTEEIADKVTKRWKEYGF